MFREYETDYTPPAPTGLGKDVLYITVLNGDAIAIPYLASMTISDVKRLIEKNLNIPPSKQKILFQDKEVEVNCLRIRHFSMHSFCFALYKPCLHLLVSKKKVQTKAKNT